MKRATMRAAGISLMVLVLLGLTVLTSAAQTVTVKWATWTRPGSEEFAMDVIQRFEARHPGIRVEWLPIADLHVQLPVYLLGDVAPDVFHMAGAESQYWAEIGLMLDLEPYLQRDPIDHIEDFALPVLQAGMLYHGERAGIRYGMPRYVNNFMTIYNKSLFDETGLAHPTDLAAGGGWDMATLRDYAMKLTRKDGDQFVQWGIDGAFRSGNNAAIAQVSTWLLANGGGFFQYPENLTNFIMDRTESIDTLQYLQDLIHRDEAWGGNFLNGTAAMRVTGIASLPSWETQIADQFDWAIAPLPKGSVSRGNVISKDLWGIASTTSHPDESWTFLKFLLSPEIIELNTRVNQIAPARRSVAHAYLDVAPTRNLHYALEAMEDATVNLNTVLVRAGEVGPMLTDVLRRILVTAEGPARSIVEGSAAGIRSLYE